MGDTPFFRKNSVRYKTKADNYRKTITIPIEIWYYICEKKMDQFTQAIAKVGTSTVEESINTVSEIEIRAKSKSALSKALAAIHEITDGVIIRMFKSQINTSALARNYPDVFLIDTKDGFMVVGPVMDISCIEKQLSRPDQTNQPSYLPVPAASNNRIGSPPSIPLPTRKDHKPQRFVPVIFTSNNGQKIHVKIDDITRMKVDVIVNAANESLRHNGGVASAISRAAGPALQQECDQYIRRYGPLRVTHVVVTQGYNLPAQYVMHVVGPMWKSRSREECTDAVYRSFKNCLDYAAKKRVSSIAMPAISSGVYGGPTDIVTQQMCQAVLDFCVMRTTITDIYLVDINEQIPQKTAQLLQRSGRVRTEAYSPPFYGHLGHALVPQAWGVNQPNGVSTRVRPNAENGPPSGPMAPTGMLSPIHAPTTKEPYLDHRTTMANGYIPSGPVMSMKNNYNPNFQKYPTRPTVTGLSGTNDVFSPVDRTANFNLSNYHPTETNVEFARPEMRRARRSSYNNTLPSANGNRTSKEVANFYHPARNPIGDCSICRDSLASPVTLRCGHVFCKDCIHQWLKDKPTCPNCGQAFGALRGNQPEGYMKHSVIDICLPGYEQYRTIEIVYTFSNGFQTTNHPNPGRPYQGTIRRAFLPDSPEGRIVLALLRRAFDSRLLFTIGRSVTTGKDDQVTWNDVHHKTSTRGGPYGYPDPNYLQRVKQELAAKGIQ